MVFVRKSLWKEENWRFFGVRWDMNIYDIYIYKLYIKGMAWSSDHDIMIWLLMWRMWIWKSHMVVANFANYSGCGILLLMHGSGAKTGRRICHRWNAAASGKAVVIEGSTLLEVFRVFDHRLSLHSRPMGGIRKCTAGPRSSEGTWCWRCACFAMFFIANH